LQVGKKFSEGMSKLSGYPEDKMIATYPTYGNIGPAGIMVALSTAEKEGRLKPGMRVGLWGVGSGVNTFLVEVVW
jgi:3-oxoacyl-[acyl-carrier-protein] synthase-3